MNATPRWWAHAFHYCLSRGWLTDKQIKEATEAGKAVWRNEQHLMEEDEELREAAAELRAYAEMKERNG